LVIFIKQKTISSVSSIMLGNFYVFFVSKRANMAGHQRGVSFVMNIQTEVDYCR